MIPVNVNELHDELHVLISFYVNSKTLTESIMFSPKLLRP